MTSTTTQPDEPGLLWLAIAKTVANLGIRWVGMFLPVLSAAFGATIGTLSSMMGLAELGGLATSVTGGLNDRGHERKVVVGSLVLAAVSAAIGLIGTPLAFAASYAIAVFGLSQGTVAGHAWIGHRVPFHRRSRAIGLYEMSWAMALLAGAPLLALVIDVFGWRGAYVSIGMGALAASALVWFRVPRSGGTSTRAGRLPPLPPSAWPPMLASAASAHAGIGFAVVTGTWLADEHGFGTAALGLVAAAYGGVELVSSGSVATITDRIGPRRAVAAGLCLLASALGLLAVAGSITVVAVAGLLLFFGGFEYAFVSSLTLVSEAAPASRGKAIGISNSLGTIARASGVALSGLLYEYFGLAGPLTSAGTATALAAIMLAATRTPGHTAPTPG